MSSCDSPRADVSLLRQPVRIDPKRLQQLAINDSGFVFDPLTGLSFNVNVTGLAMLRALKDGVAPAELSRLLAEGYERDGTDDLRGDVDDFLGQLARHGLGAPSEADRG